MTPWLDNLRSEIRYAWRMVRKTPGASSVAVLSLALGIGANTAIFSLVSAVLMKMLPVKAPQQLYMVGSRGEHFNTSWNYPDYRAMSEHNTVFDGLAAYSLGLQSIGVQPGEGAQQATELAYGVQVSGNYFQVFGVTPAAGRLFTTAVDRAPDAAPYAVLSYPYWQRRFAGSAVVIGSKLLLNGYPFTVIGVAPRGFSGADVAFKPDLFVPIMMRSALLHMPFSMWNSRHMWWMGVIGRLKPSAPLKKAETELYSICKDQEDAERRTVAEARFVNKARQIALLPAGRGYSFIGDELRKPLLILFTVVALVLLIACANVANLMLARGAAREREIAVRLAVGASRWRIGSELFAESVFIAALGGLGGILVSLVGVRVLMRFAPHPGWAPVSIDAPLDWSVLGFTMAVSILCGVLFGLAPAFRSSRPDLLPALKEDVPGSTGASRLTLRRVLVVAQVALSLLLLVGAGLFIRTLGNLRALDPGFTPEQVMTAEVDPTRFGYKGQRTRDFYDALTVRAERLPGVRSASLTRIVPLSGSMWNGSVSAEGYAWKPGEKKWVYFDGVGPRYFATLGTPLLLGREFEERDNPALAIEMPDRFVPGQERPEPPGPRSAIVNEAFARHFFAGRNAVGMHVSLDEKYRADKLYEIVGVVKDARYFNMKDAVDPMIFIPIWRQPANSCTLVLRTTAPPSQITAALRRQIAALDPVIPLLNVRTLQNNLDQNILSERLIATLSGFFGALGLLISAVGLYGVISYAVTRRTREIGIRVALGARRGAVLWLVFRDALLMVAIGAVFGIACSFAATRLVKAFLYGVGAQDIGNILIAALILAVAAMAACLVPAQRATRVDPMVALRYE